MDDLEKYFTKLLLSKGFTEEILKKELAEYFSKDRKVFTLQTAQDGTEFQKKVWDVISQIPYGETLTYKDIARKVGNVKSVRAVANACGANSFPLIIPCHRVVGSNGYFGGYALGIEIKKRLLEFELGKF